jgi:hypothetical protein
MKPPTDTYDFWSAEQVAERLGISPRHLRPPARRGMLADYIDEEREARDTGVDEED